MIKLDILAARLRLAQVTQRSWSAADRALASAMIVYSDNISTQSLYVEIGQKPGMWAFDQLVGTTETTPDWS